MLRDLFPRLQNQTHVYVVPCKCTVCHGLQQDEGIQLSYITGVWQRQVPKKDERKSTLTEPIERRK